MVTKKKTKKKTKRNARMFNVTLTPEVDRILKKTKRSTKGSWGSIICHALTFCEENGGFEQMQNHIPKSVLRAQEIIEKWKAGAK